LGRNLFWLEAIDDASLQHLYINCKGLLMASEAEGFGLPLIEAAQHGLPILARDIPVFRELADSFASYFSGHDAQDMAGQLHAWLQDIDFHVAPASRGMKRLNWQASAQQLLEEILCV
jgi:glycosyltransferase involved in cell wall biosynthesis